MYRWYKSKYFSSPNDIIRSAKKNLWKTLHEGETTSKAAAAKFFRKILKRKKIPNEDFNLCEAEIPLDEIFKSIFSNK